MKNLVYFFISRYVFAISIFTLLVAFGFSQDFSLNTSEELESTSAMFGIAIFAPNEDIFTMQKFAKEQIKPAIQSIRTVAKASIPCKIKREVHVLLDPLLLEAHGLSPSQVASIVGSATTNVPTNSLDSDANQDITIDGNELKSLKEVEEIFIDAEYGLRVNDVAEIREALIGLEFSAKFNSNPVVLLKIQKLKASSTLKVIKKIEKKLETIRIPDGYELKVVSNTDCQNIATDFNNLAYEEIFFIDQTRLIGTGLSVSDVFDTIQIYTIGIESGEMLYKGERIPIVTKIHPLFMQDEQAFLSLPIYAPSLQGNLPLGQLGNFEVPIDQ